MEIESLVVPPLSRHVYWQAKCPTCGKRACVTQRVEYNKSYEACIVCPNAGEGQTKCPLECCHGCECVSDCADYLEGLCPCDCHLKVLRLHVVTIDLVDEEEERCRCGLCRNSSHVPTLDYCPGYNGSEGHWISNRPPECRHFLDGVPHGQRPISTYYDNSDGRNYRLDQFFIVTSNQ
jgi:hypothetical protein